jgi:hypothetical protein
MAKDFVPRRDDQLKDWSNALSTNLSASYASYGLDESDAIEYAELTVDFAEALRVSQAGPTRTAVTVQEKSVCRTRLVERTRELNRRIQANPNVSNADRASLGLTVPKSTATSVGRPDDAPLLSVDHVIARTVRIRLRGALSTTRGKPQGCAGASIYWVASEEWPTNTAGWTYLCGVTRTFANVTLPASLTPGTRVWLSAAWYNAKAQQGNGSTAVSVRVQDGVEVRRTGA